MMAQSRSRITRKGQITIPIEFRREFDLREGDEVSFQRHNGVLELVTGRTGRTRSTEAILAELPDDSTVRRTLGSLAQYATRQFESDDERLRVERSAAEEGWIERERRLLAQRSTDG